MIYADPPWAWTKGAFVNRGSARTVEKEYPTMQPAQVAALPVESWARDDAVLFLWTTGPKLPIALEVIRSWGFTYKTIGFTWVKRNKKTRSLFWGLGFYTRANAELCLVATRGSPSRMSASVHQIVESPVARHS
ncbi:MAG: MT-A70 family methyltransferase [Candidatus Lutacidiplasmatales archaeon]